MDKSSDAFRTISEVAEDLDLPQHVLRFWETRFSQIKPLKRGGGRRYYRPDDVELLKGIRHLLYGEGYTIKGVQRILKDQGVRFVMNLWQEGSAGLEAKLQNHDADAFGDLDFVESGADSEEDAIDLPPAPLRPARQQEYRSESDVTATRHTGTPGHARQATLERAREAAFDPSRSPSRFIVPDEPHLSDDSATAEVMAQRFAPRSAERAPQARQSALTPMIERFRSGTSRLAADTAARTAPQPSSDDVPINGLSRDDVRRLQATLFELLECKRLLDQTR